MSRKGVWFEKEHSEEKIMVEKGTWLRNEAWLETELGEERIMVRKGK